jgi:hypothetical protein
MRIIIESLLDRGFEPAIRIKETMRITLGGVFL